MKNVFVAATRQNDGKTMVSLGMFNEFCKRYSKVAYMKPVGQQYRIIDGEKIDKDAVLMQQTYNLTDKLSDMSPIAVPRGFTSKYIREGDRNTLVERVSNSYQRLSDGKNFVLIEGTGHAGVGSVFDMSNADTAKLLGAKVVIVTLGGIGRPIDEIMLNKAVFESKGVELLGVIINKVNPQKIETVRNIVSHGLKRFGIRLFGVVPLVQNLSRPSVAELVEDLDGELLSGNDKTMGNTVGKFIIGDMQPHAAVETFTDNTLLIVPGNRDGIIVTALYESLLDAQKKCNVAGMVFTDGTRPPLKIMRLINRSNIPVMLVNGDSFSVATKINNSIFKLRAEETEKIQISQSLVEEHVDIDQICELL